MADLVKMLSSNDSGDGVKNLWSHFVSEFYNRKLSAQQKSEVTVLHKQRFNSSKPFNLPIPPYDVRILVSANTALNAKSYTPLEGSPRILQACHYL